MNVYVFSIHRFTVLTLLIDETAAVEDQHDFSVEIKKFYVFTVRKVSDEQKAEQGQITRGPPPRVPLPIATVSTTPLLLLQCAVVGRDEYRWRSASLSIRLPEWMRRIGPGQPVRPR